MVLKVKKPDRTAKLIEPISNDNLESVRESLSLSEKLRVCVFQESYSRDDRMLTLFLN